MIAAAWVGLGLYPVVRGLLRLRAVRFDARRVLGAALVAAVAVAAHLWLTDNPDRGLAALRTAAPAGFVLRQNFWTSLGRPGIFALSHIVFFGPVVLLAIFLWPRSSTRCESGALPCSSWPAWSWCSRSMPSHDIWSTLVPLVVVFTTVAVQRRLGNPLVVVFGIFTLAASKVWLQSTTDGSLTRRPSSISRPSTCS